VGSPAVTSADAGYYGEQVIEALERPSMDLLVPPDRQMHGDPGLRGTLPARASTTDWMRYKLRTTIAAALYRMRSAIVETGVQSDQKRARPASLSSARPCQCAR
jgi:hypothetical protein